MSKNNSPQKRPTSVRRRRPKPQNPTPAPATTATKSRVRRLLPSVLIPHGIAILLVIVAAVAVLLFSASSMVALPATIAQLWLALNMSPVAGSGEVVGVIPMVPGMVLIWAVARRVYNSVKKKASIADLAVLTTLVLLLPLVLAGVASLMLRDASAVLEVDAPPAPVMIGRVLLVHLIALVLGMGPRLWRALIRRYGGPPWLVDAAIQAFRFLIAYAVVALAVVIVMIAVNHRIFLQTLTGYEGGGAVPALLVLSLLYLPNTVIYTMGVLAGAPLHFGDGLVSLFNVTLVPLPPLPVLAAVPSMAPEWAVILLLIPATVAVWVCLRTPLRLPVTLVSAVITAVFFLAAAVLAGGHLGVYGQVGLALLPAAGLMFFYPAVAVLLITGIDRIRAGIRRSAATPPAAVPATGAATGLDDEPPVPAGDDVETEAYIEVDGEQQGTTGAGEAGAEDSKADDAADADGTDGTDDAAGPDGTDGAAVDEEASPVATAPTEPPEIPEVPEAYGESGESGESEAPESGDDADAQNRELQETGDTPDPGADGPETDDGSRPHGH